MALIGFCILNRKDLEDRKEDIFLEVFVIFAVQNTKNQSLGNEENGLHDTGHGRRFKALGICSDEHCI
jgi:hypothetical protein